jgi:hypothetical protein
MQSEFSEGRVLLIYASLSASTDALRVQRRMSLFLGLLARPFDFRSDLKPEFGALLLSGYLACGFQPSAGFTATAKLTAAPSFC